MEWEWRRREEAEDWGELWSDSLFYLSDFLRPAVNRYKKATQSLEGESGTTHTEVGEYLEECSVSNSKQSRSKTDKRGDGESIYIPLAERIGTVLASYLCTLGRWVGIVQ